jgi:hypothetical protein
MSLVKLNFLLQFTPTVSYFNFKLTYSTLKLLGTLPKLSLSEISTKQSIYPFHNGTACWLLTEHMQANALILHSNMETVEFTVQRQVTTAEPAACIQDIFRINLNNQLASKIWIMFCTTMLLQVNILN